MSRNTAQPCQCRVMVPLHSFLRCLDGFELVESNRAQQWITHISEDQQGGMNILPKDTYPPFGVPLPAFRGSDYWPKSDGRHFRLCGIELHGEYCFQVRKFHFTAPGNNLESWKFRMNQILYLIQALKHCIHGGFAVLWLKPALYPTDSVVLAMKAS